MKRLEKYSFGVGDRFGHQAKPQLQAVIDLKAAGIDVVPVWNKSNREHLIIGSEPESTRKAADAAVHELGWSDGHYCDADHIRLDTVDRFLPWCDFFTIDVADSIGVAPSSREIESFIERHPELTGRIEVLGIDRPLGLDLDAVSRFAANYLTAIQEAGRIYRHVAAEKGEDFVTEVSIDETDGPQTPTDLLLILAAISDERIPIQTIAPKFTGRFNKGVDYVGDVRTFEKEFEEDLAVLAYAVKAYDLPENLKLSVHSGSDKFSLYGPIRRVLKKTNAGLHLKTAGTTWLEEVIGLAEAGSDGLARAKEIYGKALSDIDELCAPYLSVIDIDSAKLPPEAEVKHWTSEQFVRAMRHCQDDPLYNPSMRQLLHVGYKIAAKMGPRYLGQLEEHKAVIAKNVYDNLFERHLKPLFLEEN